MSKILTAVWKAHGEVSDILAPMIDGENVSEAAAIDDDAAVRAVLGGDGTEPSTEQTARSAVRPEIRELPLRITAGEPVLPFDGTNPSVAEQYRIIRTKLAHHVKRPQMVLISSSCPSDGKTITAINIAGALALKSDAKVVLLDTDFRRSTIHTQLGIPASPGLADVLSGTATLQQAIIRAEQLPNLYVVSAGEPLANPSELLDSPRWTGVCNDLRSMFRFVIADSPPVASVADYDLLQASCDGIVIVARPDHTHRQTLLKVLETIPKEKLIGVVMNRVSNWIFGPHDSYVSYYGSTAGGSGARAANDSQQ